MITALIVLIGVKDLSDVPGAPMKILNPKFLVVSALCGGMGVLSGYAIYLTYLKVTADHARARFVLTLLITALISYAIEWIREVIREGKIEHATHPIFRTMGTYVIVLMFEFFIIGFHTTSDLSLEALRCASMQLLGPEAANSSANWTLVLAGGLWIVVGALLAVWLSQSVKKPSGTNWGRIVRAGGNGIIGGLVFAPFVMALYILGGRCLAALLDVFHQYGGSYSGGNYQNPLPTFWHNIFLSQNTLTSGWLPSALLFCVTLPLGLLDMAAQKNMALFMACYLTLAAFVVSYPAARKSKALKNPALQIVLGAIWVVCLAYTAGPFCDAMFRVARQLAHVQPLETLGTIMVSAAVIWAVPGLLLGSLTPLLRRVAADTRKWAFVGYGSALLLMAATLWARAWWPLIPALAALAVGYMFQRGSLVYEYWPFAALCVATGICGATSIAQHVTFANEVLYLHSIDVLQPTPANQPAITSRVKSYDELSPEERAQAQQSSNSSFAIIHGADGRLELVPVRMLDAESVKEAQQFWNDNAAAIQQLTDSVTKNPPQPKMPAAKDLPPLNPFIEAAVKRLNDADAAPQPPPAQPPPAPTPPPSDDLAMNGAFAELRAQNPGSFPSASQTHKNLNKLIPPVVETAPPDVATSPAAIAPPVATQAAPPDQSSTVNPQANASSNTTAETVDKDAAEALELSLSGSLGFWVTIGLLACWSMEEHEEIDQQEDAA
jgi:hypothetical protein